MITLFRRVLIPTLLASALAAAGSAHASRGDALDQFLDISLKEKKSVVLYVNGLTIPGRVTRMDGENVELTSREFSRIVVRRDEIDAVASN